MALTRARFALLVWSIFGVSADGDELWDSDVHAMSLLQLKATKGIANSSALDFGQCAFMGDLHPRAVFPGAGSLLDFHTLGLTRLFQSKDGYIIGHGYQCFFSNAGTPNAGMTMFALSVEGVKIIFTGDASGCYKNYKMRIEKDGVVIQTIGKTRGFGYGVSLWAWDIDGEQSIEGTTIKYEAIIVGWTVLITGGSAALGNEWKLQVVGPGDTSGLCNDEWKADGATFSLNYLDFDITMKNVDQTQNTLCGAPDQGLVRSPQSAAAISTTSAEATSIFSQDDLDGMCEGCKWPKMTSIAGQANYAWPPGSGNILTNLVSFPRQTAPPVTDQQAFDDCVTFFGTPSQLSVHGNFLSGVCARLPADCVGVADADALCESFRTPASCTQHPYLGDPASPEEECNRLGCSFQRGQQLCDSLKTAPAEDGLMYEDCVSDWCDTCDEHIVDEYDLFEQGLHPDSASAVQDPHLTDVSGTQFDLCCNGGRCQPCPETVKLFSAGASTCCKADKCQACHW